MSIMGNTEARLDDNEFSTGVFVDFKKAFDIVDHKKAHIC